MSAEKLTEAAKSLRKSAEFTNELNGAFLKAVAAWLEAEEPDAIPDGFCMYCKNTGWHHAPRVALAWLREKP